MSVNLHHSFWRASPPAAKWALSAAAFLGVVAVIPFIALVVVVTQSEQVSPMNAIFGPGRGNPAITWLYFTVPPLVIQAAAGLALRHSGIATPIAGIVGVLVLATVAVVWLGAILVLGVNWLMTGDLAGDFYDLLGMVFLGLPILLVTAALNGRAALLGIRDLHGRAPHPATV